MSATPVAIPAASGALAPTTGNNITYHGFSARETTGTDPCVFRIREGGATGKMLDPVKLSAGESAREYYQGGVNARGGLYFELVSGTAPEGTVRYS